MKRRPAGGNSYADVEIPFLTFGDFVEQITDLKARTIKPDGSIVEFNGKAFEKPSLRAGVSSLPLKPLVCLKSA